MSETRATGPWANLGGRIKAVSEHPVGAASVIWLKRALFVGILYILWRQISSIGWSEVLSSLPTSPLFYLFWAARYVLTPAFETQTYRIIWQRPMTRHFWVFMRKRVYNQGVAGYSGEGFLTLWANRNLGWTTKQVLISIKDANLLSGLSANFVTLILVVIAFGAGLAGPLMAGVPRGEILLLIGTLTPLALVIGVLVLRTKLIHLSWPDMRSVLAWHGLRHLGLIVLAVAMYAAAIPGVPLIVWLSFVLLFMVLTRIPFLPNQDLVYLAAALAVTSSVGVPADVMAGVLVCEAALMQIANFGLFIGTSHLGKAKANEGQSAASDTA